MRIDPNAPTGLAGARRAGRSTASASGAFSRALGTEAAAPAQSLSTTNLVEGLLAFQEVEDSTTGRRRRAWQRGAEILDRLDALKLGILDGSMSEAKLADLSRMAREGRAGTGDPQLEEVLGEIELRAEVELAKLQKAAEIQK